MIMMMNDKNELGPNCTNVRKLKDKVKELEERLIRLDRRFNTHIDSHRFIEPDLTGLG